MYKLLGDIQGREEVVGYLHGTRENAKTVWDGSDELSIMHPKCLITRMACLGLGFSSYLSTAKSRRRRC